MELHQQTEKQGICDMLKIFVQLKLLNHNGI
ncbi:hypothetical protein T03_10839 [Trichinella britovi]|uniref:Uncharacterized protein n=1 Tax=Trichinella britovi TaxID=45882 RepID=A0A0V1BQB7_TRIBR|nr:hypothetical protein T03_10839 [Trichinella britovi]